MKSDSRLKLLPKPITFNSNNNSIPNFKNPTTVSDMFFSIFFFFFFHLKSVPVAASTISLLMLSLDRYATVKHPRLAQLRQRRFLPTFLAFVSWITAICISIPILLDSGINSTVSINTTGLNHTIPMPTELTSALRFIYLALFFSLSF